MKLIDHLRKAVLKGHGARLRKILLTKEQSELVRFVAHTRDGVKTADVVKLQGVSAQCASSKLSNLADKGYLVRVECSADTGGIEYVYTVKPGLA